MESYILLHNNFYNKESEILLTNTKNLLHTLQIPFANIQKIALEEKFLPFINPLEFYTSLLKILLQAQENKQKILLCDSQSIFVIKEFIDKLYKDLDFRTSLKNKFEVEIDILTLENCFTFLPEILYLALEKTDFIRQRWSGFRCAFLLDSALQSSCKEIRFLEQLENLSGLRILPFFKESYGYLLHNNAELGYKMGAMDYYEMVDCGIDFIVTLNIANFTLLDTHAKNIQRVSGRDDLETPILFLPQILLALFKDTNAKSLLFNAHKITPRML